MLQTSVFKFLQIGMVTLIVLALALSTAGAQPAQAANANAPVSAGWMPFAGSLYDSQTNSHININGLVHIVARWKQISASQVEIDIDANLPAANVTVTTDTGIPYNAYGAGQSSIFLPPNPVFPTDHMSVYVPSFWLALPPNPVLPPNPIKPFGFGLQFDLVFSAIGVLDLDASTVQVTQVTEELGLGDG